MTTNRVALASTIALLAVLTTAGAALAADAVANSVVNVRSGPGTGYGIVDALFAGEEVDVVTCSGSWCKIRHPGPDGWVSKSRLSAMDDDGEGPSDVPFNFGVTVGPGGPTLSFGIGDTPAAPPPPPPAAPKACLFDGANFTSYSACYTPGDSDNNMALTGPGYDNAIGSIDLSGGAHIKVCTDAFFGGSCATFGSDKPFLGGFTDTISSFQVY